MTDAQEEQVKYLVSKINETDDTIKDLYKQLAKYAGEERISSYDTCEGTLKEIKYYINYRHSLVCERRGYIKGLEHAHEVN